MTGLKKLNRLFCNRTAWFKGGERGRNNGRWVLMREAQPFTCTGDVQTINRAVRCHSSTSRHTAFRAALEWRRAAGQRGEWGSERKQSLLRARRAPNSNSDDPDPDVNLASLSPIAIEDRRRHHCQRPRAPRPRRGTRWPVAARA